MDSELRNWNNWTDPDFFLTERHRESRMVSLFLRQILPGKLFRTKMTLTGWCLIVVSLGLGLAAYNTASNILFLALSLLLSSMILSGILSLINFKKLHWVLKAPSSLSVGEAGIATINLTNNKTLFPSMAVYFKLQTKMSIEAANVYMQAALNPGESCTLKWTVIPQKRGQFKLCLFEVGSRFPFGFLQRTIGSELQSKVIVWPARTSYFFQDFAGGQRIASGRAKKSPGQGSDLLNIRAYEPGDAPRFVDWKATARTGRLMIRQFAREGESGYHLQVDSDASRWNDQSFEQLCSLVRSLAEDLFHCGQLETVQLGDSDPIAVRSLDGLHALLDALASFERSEPSANSLFKQQANHLTFRPLSEGGVGIYLEGNHAGQTND